MHAAKSIYEILYKYICKNETKVYKHTEGKSYAHKKRETHKNKRHYIRKKQFQIVQRVYMRQCQPQLYMTHCQLQPYYMGSEQSGFFNHTKLRKTCDHNRKISLIPFLIMFHTHITKRTTEIDDKKNI